VQVRIALAVGVAAQIDGQAIDEDREIGPVIGVESTDQVLFGLAASLVLIDDQPGHETQDVGGAALRAELEVAAGNDLLGRR